MTPTRAIHRHTGIAALVAALAVCLSPPIRAAEPSEFSQAEKLVFVDHQLDNVKPPTSLRYTFVKSGSLEPGYEDDVRLTVKPTADKLCCEVEGKFLSGTREEKLPQIEDAKANPVILFFLEHDIREMQRLTKGQSGYFRKRIRMTMADAATVRDTKVSYAGHDVAAKEVTLSPYVQDPLRARFERYAEKRYTFVLTKGVPGGVYQVRTSLPGAQPTDAPALEEVLTLAEPAPSNKP